MPDPLCAVADSLSVMAAPCPCHGRRTAARSYAINTRPAGRPAPPGLGIESSTRERLSVNPCPLRHGRCAAAAAPTATSAPASGSSTSSHACPNGNSPIGTADVHTFADDNADGRDGCSGDSRFHHWRQSSGCRCHGAIFRCDASCRSLAARAVVCHTAAAAASHDDGSYTGSSNVRIANGPVLSPRTPGCGRCRN
eukprot:SAG31_NODE_4018_length_3662_cov_2.628964_4_plen_196_part_00